MAAYRAQKAAATSNTTPAEEQPPVQPPMQSVPVAAPRASQVVLDDERVSEYSPPARPNYSGNQLTPLQPQVDNLSEYERM